MFVAESVASPDDLERIRGEGGLGLFVRSLVGLDREAAKQALAGLVSGRTLSANQIEFIDLIIDYLTDRGVMDPRRLYESPFTERERGVHSHGSENSCRHSRPGQGEGGCLKINRLVSEHVSRAMFAVADVISDTALHLANEVNDDKDNSHDPAALLRILAAMSEAIVAPTVWRSIFSKDVSSWSVELSSISRL
jgi:EcoEI R protein C-terminal